MKIVSRALLASACLAVGVSAAAAECGIERGSVRILSNDFPALQAVAAAAEECAGGAVTVTKNQNKDFKDLQVAALKANPAVYSTVMLANSTLVPLLNEGLVRPLDDYVAKYGADLTRNQLVTIDGKVMAVAFMANAQHLFYRADILEKAGVQPPKTYEEVLAAAKAIREKGLMEHPITGTYQSGWNLAQEFVNMYLGHGGTFFKEGSAEPAIANEKGVAALTLLKELTGYMNPDFLTLDSNGAQGEWEAGKAALMVLWGSRAGAVLDDKGSTPDIVAGTRLAGAPTVAGGTVPATTLWWDGFTIAANASDEDAEASFRAMVHGTSPDMMAAHKDAAVWLIKGYEPGPTAIGVSGSLAAQPYPMLPYMGLLHTALGAELNDFFLGKESAEQALADAEAAYRTAATEAGFLK